MFSMKRLIYFAANPQNYIWIDAVLLKETRKAVFISFDNKQIWLSKVWILRIKRTKITCGISIKISEYHLAKKV